MDNKDKKIEEALNKVLEEKLSKETMQKKIELEPKVVRYILYKMRTKKEVLDKFRNEDQEVLNLIIDYLEEEEYLNDKIYAEVYIEDALGHKLNSIFELKYKMIGKGVPERYIDKAIEKKYPELLEYEINNILRILENRKNEDSKKTVNYLYRKGYQGVNIKKAIEQFEEN